MTTPQPPYPPQGQPYPPQGQPYPPQGQPYPPQGQPYPPQGQGWGPAPRVPAPAPIPGSIAPRSRGLLTAVLAAGTVVGIVAVATGAAGAVVRTHVHPYSVVEGSEPATSITAIEIVAGMHDVVVTTHAGSTIEWQTGWYGDPGAATDATVRRTGTTLTFSADEDSWRWGDWDWFDRPADRRTLTIDVPEDLLADLTVDAGAGSVTVDGDFGATELGAGVGDVDLTGTVASLKVEAGVGRVDAVVATPGRVIVAGGVGTALVDLGTRTAPESVSVEGGIGTVTVRVPTLTSGWDVTMEQGVGAVTDDAPAADPEGVRVDSPVPLALAGGVGTVTVEPSTSRH